MKSFQGKRVIGFLLAFAMLAQLMVMPLPVNADSTEPFAVGELTSVSTETAVNLTSAGTLDWLNIGGLEESTDTYKLASPMIQLTAAIGTNGHKQSQNNSLFVRSSAAEDKELSNKKNSRSFSGPGANFQIVVPAENGELRELKLYFAAWNAKVVINAELGGNVLSTNTFDTGAQGGGTSPKAGIYSVKYSGSEADQNLTITGTVEAYGNDEWSNFALSAAAFSEVNPLQTLTINESPINIIVGDSKLITYTAVPANAVLTPPVIEVENADILQIKNNNEIVGLKEGTTTIKLVTQGVESEPVTVTVSEDSVVTPKDVNLALGKTVTTAASSEGSSLSLQKMLDGDYNSRFSTKNNNWGGNTPIVLDLGEVQSINNVNLFWEVSYSTSYVVETSQNNQDWTRVATVSGKPNYAPDFLYFEAVRARYVRLNINSVKSNGVSIFEFEVYNRQQVPVDYQISDIRTSYGSLMPVFAAYEKEYEINVGAETESIDISAVLMNPSAADAKLSINGVSVDSSEAATVSLASNKTLVNIVTEDPNDSQIKQEYTVTVYKLDYNFGNETYRNLVQSAKSNPGFSVSSSVSSFWSAGGAGTLVDGDRYTVAQPALEGGNKPWDINLDLGSNYMVDQIKFISNRGSYLDQYDVSISLNGSTWNKVAEEIDGNGENKTYRFSPSSTRYVKITGKTAVSYSSAAELEVYGVEINVGSIINSLSAMKIARGQTLLNTSVPDGYKVDIVSSSNESVIGLDGTIYPVKNLEQSSELVFKVTDESSGSSEDTAAILLSVPALLDVKAIPALQAGTVLYGTNKQKVIDSSLPKTVAVTLSDDSTENLLVNWSNTSVPEYNAILPGNYTFTGSVQLNNGISNEENIDLTANKIITVGEAVVQALYIFPKDQVLPVPQAGTTKRKFFVHLNEEEGVFYPEANWSIVEDKDYVSIDPETGLLTVRPSNAKAAGEYENITVKVQDKNGDTAATMTVRLEFLPNGQSEPSPLEKPGYTLYHDSDFNGDDIDRTAWSDYYLRNWAIGGDDKTQADYYFEDGALVLKIDENTPAWSPMDGDVKCVSLMSFEGMPVHNFHRGSKGDPRFIPEFNGSVTTKHGYFEMRAKMPSSPDGSHMAWWTVGTQEDQNIFEAGSYGISDQINEIDVNESSFGHIQNNQDHIAYHRWDSTMIPYDENNVEITPNRESQVSTILDKSLGRLDSEFHNYGMEWDENGLKFYFDGRLIREIKIQLDYRQLTFLSLYTNAWGGADQGIYPKEFAIDYFRIYKKTENIGKPNDIYFDKSTIPQKLAIPSAGSTADMQIAATVVDEMHNPVDAELEWYFASPSDKSFKTKTTIPGAAIDSKTGLVTIDSSIADGTLLKVSAKVKGNDRVRQSYRVFAESPAAAIKTSVFFNEKSSNAGKSTNKIQIPLAGDKTVDLSAKLYDQYLQPIDESLSYSLVMNTPGLKAANPAGVELSADGRLTVSSEAVPGEVFYVQASSGIYSNNYIVKLVDQNSQEDKYTVSYDANGGTGTITSASAILGDAITLSNGSGFSRAGYNFIGWKCNGVDYAPSQTFTWNQEQELVFYAQWQQISSGENNNNNNNSSNSGNNNSNGNTTTSNVITVNTKVEGNSVKAAVTSEDIGKALAKAQPDINGVRNVVVEVKAVAGAQSYVQQLPADAFASNTDKKKFTLNTPLVTLQIPESILNNVDIRAAKNVEISAAIGDTKGLDSQQLSRVGNRPVVDLNIKLDGKTLEWNNPNAPVTVTLAYTPTAEELKNTDYLQVYYIDDNGALTAVPNAKYDKVTGKFTFSTTHFSRYAVAYYKKTFNDVAESSWSANAVQVLASKEIIEGKSESSFDPGSKISRGEFIGWLVKALGLTAEVKNNFSDVTAKNKYYEEIAVAKALGITNGTGDNKFSPESLISRQDMMVLIVKALKKADIKLIGGTAKDIAKYADVSSISAYAQEAAATLVKEQIISGSGNNLKPKANLTRAEAAAVVYNIYKR